MHSLGTKLTYKNLLTLEFILHLSYTHQCFGVLSFPLRFYLRRNLVVVTPLASFDEVSVKESWQAKRCSSFMRKSNTILSKNSTLITLDYFIILKSVTTIFLDIKHFLTRHANNFKIFIPTITKTKLKSTKYVT